MERVQLFYHHAARKKRVHIISACGFDSIPADCGVVWLKEKRKDLRLNHVESFIKINATYGNLTFLLGLGSRSFLFDLFVASFLRNFNQSRNFGYTFRIDTIVSRTAHRSQ